MLEIFAIRHQRRVKRHWSQPRKGMRRSRSSRPLRQVGRDMTLGASGQGRETFQAGIHGQAAHQVGVGQSLSRSAAAEVVDGRQDDQAVGARVHHQTEIAEHAAAHVAGFGQTALGQHADPGLRSQVRQKASCTLSRLAAGSLSLV